MSTMSMLLESNQACQNQLMTTNYHVNMMPYGKRGYHRLTAYRITSIYHDVRRHAGRMNLLVRTPLIC